ncbi:AvrE-family type 3 secretion system effector [Pseudomonas sp. B21-056]|uniref:AvrE-family type 3 secretion system effector n=1 Tax=Pseudomonas sp. B21-056 TaxID=2895495 RepID=UPI00222EDE4C|nr:AvrE-family type 3 secretion system effector [Pseudomonas sp. B21-056]UZE26468.1 AvrE-family type 3 secretion system effector [Pseudomonas sp. B21-056]
MEGSRPTPELQQRTEQPTQRASQSLTGVGKRMLKSVGKLFQKPKPPKQSAAKPPAPLSNERAATNAARLARSPDSRLQGSDGLRQSLLRPSPGQASSSATQANEFDEPPVSKDQRRVRFNLPDDPQVHSERRQTPVDLTDEEAATNAARKSQQPDSRLQGSDGLRRSLLRTRPDQASGSGTKTDETDEAPALPSLVEHPLRRSGGKRFDLNEEGLVPSTRPQEAITLGAGGKPDFSTFSTSGLAPLLGDILGKPGQTYLAHESKPGVMGHQLLESNGHLLHLMQDDSGLALLRSSKEALDVSSGPPAQVSLQREAGHLQIVSGSGHQTQELPGKAHIAHLTGVHQKSDGDRLRVHEDRLYQFDLSSARWKAPEGTEDLTFNSLATGGNGSVYAKSDDVIVDLSSPLMPHLETTDLTAFSVAADNMAAVLSGTETQSVQLTDMSPGIDGPRREKTKALELDGGQAQAAAIGLSADRLFVADTQGRLYSADRSAFENDEPLLRLMPEQAHYQLADQPLGGHHSVSGFISGDDGRVHALITNRQGEVHTHALDEQDSRLESGWNLSGALVLDNVRGLTAPAAPAPADRLNLDRAGLVGLSAGRIQRWEATAQCWKDAGIKDVDRLQRGADSNAYVLKGGKLLKLDVKPQHPNLAFSPTTALAPTPRSTKVTMGKEIEGLDDRVITAFAMVSDKQFVALDDQNRLTAHHKTGKPVTLEFPGLDGDIKALSLDEKHNLHALTSTGALYSLAKEDWQAVKLADHLRARWTPVPTPAGQPVTALYSNDNNVLSAQVEDAPGNAPMQFKGGQWQAFAPRPVEENGLNDTYARINRAHKTLRIPGTGLTAKLDVNVLGRSGMEKSQPASASEFIRANVYKNTLETPRWMKNVGNHIQHRYHGREGLTEVYDSQSILFKQLELVHEAAGTPPTPGNDLKARIARLELGPQGAELIKELEAFRDELEKHSYTALMAIGQGYGQFKNLRQRDGLLNMHGELAKPSARTQFGKKLADLGSKLNIKSSGHDLVKELQDALVQIAPSADNRTASLLGTLKDHGLKLSHAKADIPLGQRRDASEDHGLTKARLALDLVTLKSLGTLLDQVEMLTPQSDMTALQKKLATLRDTTYAENPVKQVTDMGFTDNAALESAYDAVKTFLKSFKKSDHAVSVNMRAATGSKDQAELADKFKGILKQLEHDDDEIALQRSYGLNLTTPFIGLADHANGPWPSAGTSGNRNYLLNAERGDAGVTLYLISEAAGNISAGVGGGKDFWPGFFDENDPARSVDIGNDRSMTPNFRLGADLTATAAASQRAGVAFLVPDEDIDGFVDNLFEGKLNPLDVLKKAVAHESYEARRFNFDITAGANADLRVGFNLSEKDSKPFSAVARLGIAANVSVNLLTYTDYSLTQKNDKVELREGGKNRPRLFNTLGIGGQVRAQLAGTHTDPTSAPISGPAPTPAVQSAANNLGVAATVTVDARTTKRVKFRYEVATPMTSKTLGKLSTSLESAFKDNATKTKLAELADPLNSRYTGMTPEEAVQAQLDGLNELFANTPSQNDKQYAALRELKRATSQHVASADNHSVLSNARFETSKTNLSGLDHEGMITSIINSVTGMTSLGNAARVADLMSRDPKLKAMLDQMQGSQGTLARVRLEPKDSLIDQIDEGSRNGTMTQGDLSTHLENRENMRIKRLTVFHTVTQTENFTSPSPLVSYNSGASLSVSKTLGRINFIYGEDQDTPIGYSFDGELSRPSEPLKDAAGQLKQEGFELKT